MSDSQNAGSTFGLGNYGENASVFGATQLPDILGLAQSKLQQAAASPDLFVQVFGYKANTEEIQAVRSQWSVGDFSQLPSVQILSAANMNGADGAYASSTQNIYLSDALFQANASPVDSVLGAAGVLTEEAFHWLDDRVGKDTQGDEGELAKNFLFGVKPSDSELVRIKTESDRGFITVGGQSVAVEQALINGNSSNNSLFGTSSNDSIYGVAGNDFLSGGNGDDYLSGGDGNDVLDGGFGFDFLDGGNGVDTVTYDFYNGGINLSLRTGVVSFPGNTSLTETVTNIENVVGSRGNDIIYGSAANNFLNGNLGNDILDAFGFGTSERDTLFGGVGNDLFVLGDVNNTYYSRSGSGDSATISDFRVGEDNIRLKRLSNSVTSVSQAYGYRLINVGNNTEIRLDNNELIGTLNGVINLNLISSTFQFVGTVPNIAPTSLQFNLNSTSLKNTDTLSINNGWVFDSNGATDLSRVDFRIKRANGTFLDVADATTFVANTADNRWGRFNYNLSLNGLNLGAGNYSLWSIAYDKAGAASAVVEKAFTVTLPPVAPTSLQFNLNTTSLRNTDTLSINSGWVYDGNGASDLSRVDFRIKRANGTFLDVADATTFVANTSDNRWGGFNYGLSLSSLNLASGNYSLWSVAYDKSGAASGVVEKAFTVTAIGDWFSQNLRDAGLISVTRSLAADGNLSRNDMLAIFRDAKDSNTLDANELSDLRTIVSNAARFTMADSVRVLSSKIANSDPANTRSGFGNLYAGSSSTQLENLIGKWFLGNDRPDAYSSNGQTQYTYRYTNGSLYQNGISYTDINQGSVGNCYFMAGLAGVAFRSSTAIQDMFTDNGDGTYAVRFYNNGVADYVTVDRYLPTDSNGNFVYAHQSGSAWGSYNNSANELWVMLAEKAYAQMNESGWIGQDGTNSYQGISGGWSDDVFKQVTNRSTSIDWSLTDSDRTNIINQFNAGRTVFMNWTNPEGGHALILTGYNSSTQQFTIYNPWGSRYTLTLSWSQILNGGGGLPSNTRFDTWSYSV